MPLYTIYQQRPPLGPSRDCLNLVEVGELEALNGPQAIDLARQLPIFKIAYRSTLAAFPIVALQVTKWPWPMDSTGQPPRTHGGTGLYRSRRAPAPTH